MDQADIPALLSRLASDEDAARKMAVFKLQSSINDPAFADVFISSGGLVILRRLIMSTGGNTLAYSLQSLTRLLEVDMGWEIFEGPTAGDLVERVVELIVTNPLVNILRGAMSILVALVSHSQSTSGAGAGGGSVRVPGTFGFRALKPAVAVHPQFFELVIAQLQSADHALCANALMLINALIRDAVSSDNAALSTAAVAAAKAGSGGGAGGYPAEEWSKFIKRLQDLGLIKAVYGLMQSSALQDLAHPLLEFQTLTKVLLKKWREVRVDVERPEHRRGLKGLHLASAPDRHAGGVNGTTKAAEEVEPSRKVGSRRHNPEKWRRLGFETENPAQEFDVTGFLGLMDLTDYVRKNEDGFQKMLQEQATKPLAQRCPVARASLAVTMILYDHFEVDKAGLDGGAKGGYYQGLDDRGDGGDNSKSNDKLFRPLLLQWSRLHTAGLLAFFRIWKATGAEGGDLDKVTELVRILIEQVVGQASRTKDVLEAEDDLHEYDCGRLRDLQMELLDLSFEDQWGQHLYQVREELRQEALQFVKEQRIRCLLKGSWFSKPMPRRDTKNTGGDAHDDKTFGLGLGLGLGIASHQPQQQQQQQPAPKRRLYTPTPWRFAKLSHNRRFLHYADFEARTPQDPGLDALTDKIDLSTISSVVSNVSAPNDDGAEGGGQGADGDEEGEARSATHSRNASTSASASAAAATQPQVAVKSSTKITIYSFADPDVPATGKGGRGGGGTDVNGAAAGGAGAGTGTAPKEHAILSLFPLNHSLASEWLDGLLMLLSQAPITAETNKLVGLVGEYGLKIRLLNVRVEAAYAGPPPGAGVVPSREGLDEDYYYEV